MRNDVKQMNGILINKLNVSIDDKTNNYLTRSQVTLTERRFSLYANSSSGIGRRDRRFSTDPEGVSEADGGSSVRRADAAVVDHVTELHHVTDHLNLRQPAPLGRLAALHRSAGGRQHQQASFGSGDTRDRAERMDILMNYQHN